MEVPVYGGIQEIIFKHFLFINFVNCTSGDIFYSRLLIIGKNLSFVENKRK